MTEECDHIQKLVEFEYWLEDGDVKSRVKTYGCTKCDILSDTELYDIEQRHLVKVDHTKCGGPDICFGCKAASLQLNTGDANHQKGMSNKKWDGELNAYRQARSEGIQPSGTSMKAITEARKASEVMGKAYDGDTMGPASSITKESVSTLKEVGAI
jgi:hypothetical protein